MGIGNRSQHKDVLTRLLLALDVAYDTADSCCSPAVARTLLTNGLITLDYITRKGYDDTVLSTGVDLSTSFSRVCNEGRVSALSYPANLSIIGNAFLIVYGTEENRQVMGDYIRRRRDE